MHFRLFLLLALTPSLLIGAARIDGRVINGSHPGIPVSPLTVSLQKIFGGDAELTLVDERLTDTLGNVRFTVEHPDTAAYFLTAEHQGVRYFSDGLRLTDGAVEACTVTVYDTIHSTAGVQVLMHHVLIDDLGDALQLRETRVLKNSADRTIVAELDEQTQRGILRFSLPAETIDFTPLSDPQGEELVRIGDAVIDRGVFVPGNKNIVYAYRLPLKNSTSTRFRIDLPAPMFDLFVHAHALRLESEQLQDMGEFTIRGVAYRRYGTTNLAAGDVIDVTFYRQKSAAAFSPAVIMLITGVLLAGGLLAAQVRKPSPSSTVIDRAALQRSKQRLMTQITQTDDALRRQALFGELKRLELRLFEKAGKKQ